MAATDIRKDVLGIVNEVQIRLGVNKTTSLTETKQAELLLNLLNDVIDECSDFGDWQQMYREVTVTASSSVGQYKIQSSDGVIKNVYEITWGDDVAPLEVRTTEDIRRLQRLASFGTPRQFAMVGVSGENPLFRVYPIPNTTSIAAEISAGGVFDCAIYIKPVLLTTSDVSAVPEYPSRMLVQGLYAKAILEENGGEPNPQYQTAYSEYLRMRGEALRRFTSDTGTDVYLVPGGARY